MKPVKEKARTQARSTFFEEQTNNPMLAEARRGINKISGATLNPSTRKFAYITLGLMYVIMILVALRYASEDLWGLCLGVLALLYTFTGPSMLHGAIAGEKEKRTWDLLMVAPVKPSQIISAKFVNGVLLNALCFAILLPFIGIGVLADRGQHFGINLLGLACAITYGLATNAYTLWISARSKRLLSAQAGTFGGLILSLVIYPIFVAILAPGNDNGQIIFNILNPVYWIGEILKSHRSNMIGAVLLVPTIYLVLTSFFLYKANVDIKKDRGEHV